jgi:hypothetical protein
MRLRLGWSLLGAASLAFGTSLAACSGGGSSSSHLAGAIPVASEQQGAPAAGRAHPRSGSGAAPSCSGTASGSFIGAPNGNTADQYGAGVLAGSGNMSCDTSATISGGEGNAIGGASNEFIGGGVSNIISGATNAFIGAGDTNQATQRDAAVVAGYYNTANGQFGTVVGGYGNALSAEQAFIGGGYQNQNAGQDAMLGGGENNTLSSAASDSVVGGGYGNSVSARYAAMAGGEYNTVSGKGAYVGGGGYNTASGEGAIVDGGYNDTAGGEFATIPGGYENSAGGTFSFAAGAYASAPQTGAFVWSDGSNGSTVLASSAAYQFVARASGGVKLWTNAAATVGATLAPGSGTWASASDRTMKTDIAPVDDAAVLAKVAALPISRWSYRTEHGVRHVGPMAQDFYAAFKVGEDDKHITSIDEDGVALAAIKALRRENGALHARVGMQSAQIAAMQRQIRSLADAVRRLEAR